jgi:hypothetical protein
MSSEKPSRLRRVIDRITRRPPDVEFSDISEENAEDPIEKEDMAKGLEPLRAMTRPLLSDEEKGRRDAVRIRELKSAKDRAKSKAFAPFEKK